MTLTEFLSARLDEDETEISGNPDCDCTVDGLPLEHGMRCGVRLLAEVDAKRRIIAEHEQRQDTGEGPYCGTCVQSDWDGNPDIGPEDWPCQTLRLLALPYSDHADYDQNWRPE